MRKVIAGINMTIDGVFDHTARLPDEEIHQHYTNLLDSSGIILYGRTTYQLMQYWQTLIKNKKMGEEITEVLEWEPGELFVKNYVRPKYARPDNEGVLIGKLPSRSLEKAMAGPGLLAQIIINKYVDHLPLHRQM